MSRFTLQLLRERLANLIARGTITRVDDSEGRQELQANALSEEVIDEAQVFGLYGFNSVPLAGAQCVVLFQGGDRGQPLVVGTTDRRHRPTDQEPGTVQLYHDTGASFTITPEGDIVATPAAGRKILLGSSAASDAVTLASEIAAIKEVFDAHKHTTTATVGTGSVGVISKPTTDFPASPGATKVDAE